MAQGRALLRGGEIPSPGQRAQAPPRVWYLNEYPIQARQGASAPAVLENFNVPFVRRALGTSP